MIAALLFLSSYLSAQEYEGIAVASLPDVFSGSFIDVNYKGTLEGAGLEGDQAGWTISASMSVAVDMNTGMTLSWTSVYRFSTDGKNYYLCVDDENIAWVFVLLDFSTIRIKPVAWDGKAMTDLAGSREYILKRKKG
jgi:hypothetical protein